MRPLRCRSLAALVSGVGGVESDFFGRLLPAGTRIDLIRLHLDTLHTTFCPQPGEFPCGFAEVGWTLQSVGQWQIIGAVPEPSAALLLLTGFMVVGISLSKPGGRNSTVL